MLLSIKNYPYWLPQLLCPVSKEDCNYIRCLGLNYSDHANESGFALPKAPILFIKPRNALANPYPAPINVPKCALDGSSDYEGELCVVIGKTGRDIPEDQALDYVLGYTASNDVSARNLQLLTAQWSFSKGIDGSCPLGLFPPFQLHVLGTLLMIKTGPVLVSSSVIKDPQSLSIKAIYDGQVVQDGNTK